MMYCIMRTDENTGTLVLASNKITAQESKLYPVLESLRNKHPEHDFFVGYIIAWQPSFYQLNKEIDYWFDQRDNTPLSEIQDAARQEESDEENEAQRVAKENQTAQSTALVSAYAIAGFTMHDVRESTETES